MKKFLVERNIPVNAVREVKTIIDPLIVILCKKYILASSN
jgi:hypothetical protein